MEMYLIALIAVILLLNWIQVHRYLKIIKELTDKLMARNYDDFLIGQELKKDKPQLETKERSDVKEMLIEKAKDESRKLKDVEKEFDEKIKNITT